MSSGAGCCEQRSRMTGTFEAGAILFSHNNVSRLFQMSGLAALNSYVDSGSEGESEEETSTSGPAFELSKSSRSEAPLHLTTAKRSGTSTVLSNPVVAAPNITLNASLDSRRHLDPQADEVKYNPK